MLTVELKINGTLVGHIYGVNKGECPREDGYGRYTIYEYEYYEPGNKKLIDGTVFHKREDGLRKLIEIILVDIK
jgi:hypothetical protein